MKFDIYEPDLPKNLRRAFMQYLHESVLVLVGDKKDRDELLGRKKDPSKFDPPHQIINENLGSTFRYGNCWNFRKPCHALHLYPLHLDNHWFGLFLDATGLSYPIQYQRPEKYEAGKIANVTVEGRTFKWIQGDKHLTAVFIVPLLIRSMVRDAKDFITYFACMDDLEFDYQIEQIDHYIDCIFEAMEKIQALKTRKSRENHYLNLEDNLIKPNYRALGTLLCLSHGIRISDEKLMNLVD